MTTDTSWLLWLYYFVFSCQIERGSTVTNVTLFHFATLEVICDIFRAFLCNVCYKVPNGFCSVLWGTLHTMVVAFVDKNGFLARKGSIL